MSSEMTSVSCARRRDSRNDSLERERASVARTSRWSEKELAGGGDKEDQVCRTVSGAEVQGMAKLGHAYRNGDPVHEFASGMRQSYATRKPGGKLVLTRMHLLQEAFKIGDPACCVEPLSQLRCGIDLVFGNKFKDDRIRGGQFRVVTVKWFSQVMFPPCGLPAQFLELVSEGGTMSSTPMRAASADSSSGCC